MLHQMGNQTDAFSGLGIDYFTGKQQLCRPLAADELCQSAQSRGIATQSSYNEELAELGFFRCNPNIRHEGKLHSPTDGRSIDCGDNWNVRVQQGIRCRSQATTTPGSLRELCRCSLATPQDLLDVIACAKRPTFPCDHKYPNICIWFTGGPHPVFEFQIGLVVQ